jgi:hypothetical protein
MSLREIALGECQFEFETLLSLMYLFSHSLRNELNECRTSAETREEELLVEIQDLQRRVQELGARCRMPPHIPFLRGEDEYRGTGSDVEYLIDDDCSLLDPTPTLIPDTRSKIKDEDDPYNSHLGFREAMVRETRGQQPSSSSEADIAHLSTTSGLDPPGLKLGDLELERLLDVIDGEASMVLATPIIASSLLDRESSDGSTAGAVVNCEASHDGILFDYDIDRDRREEDVELEGTSGRVDYDEVDDGSNRFGHDFTVDVGMGEGDSHSRTISDDTPTSPSVNYSSSRETSIDDDGGNDDRSGHDDHCGFDDDPLEHQLPRDHGDQQGDHEKDQEE